jgi:cardiolipin synthase
VEEEKRNSSPMKAEKKSDWLKLPNVLSLLRILLIPVFLVLMVNRKTAEAFYVFLFAGLTDILDGSAARLLHQKTKIGAILDPAADKLLMTASFIILTIPAINSPNVIPSWLTISVIGRDLLIASAALVLFMLKGQKTFLPSLLGKTCTVLQVMVPLLVLLLNYRQVSSPLLLWLYYLTLIFTFLSAVHYAFIGYKMLSQPREV